MSHWNDLFGQKKTQVVLLRLDHLIVPENITNPPATWTPTRGNQWDATLKDEGQAEGTLEANFSKAGRVFDELQTHQRSTI